MKNTLGLVFMISLFVMACTERPKNSKKDNVNLLSIIDTVVQQPSKKDTILLKSLNDCVDYYNLNGFYPNEFINTLQINELHTPWHTLQFLDLNKENTFFIVYSYCIEDEEGKIEMISCDSLGKVHSNMILSQIYQNITVEKTGSNLYRVYGNNPAETFGISDNLNTNDSDFDFDFNVRINKMDSVIISKSEPKNRFAKLINAYENNVEVDLKIEATIFGGLKQNEFVTAYYENKIVCKTDRFIILGVKKVIEEGGLVNYLTLNSYTLDGRLISQTDELVYHNDEWSGSEFEIAVDTTSLNIIIKETRSEYGLMEDTVGNIQVQDIQDSTVIRYEFTYDSEGKIHRDK